MKYTEDTKEYTIIIEDGNCLCDDCLSFEETDDCGTFKFTGTLKEFEESLSYGEFFQDDIRKEIQKWYDKLNDEDPIGLIYGKKYDHICFYLESDQEKVENWRSKQKPIEFISIKED